MPASALDRSGGENRDVDVAVNGLGRIVGRDLPGRVDRAGRSVFDLSESGRPRALKAVREGEKTKTRKQRGARGPCFKTLTDLVQEGCNRRNRHTLMALTICARANHGGRDHTLRTRFCGATFDILRGIWGMLRACSIAAMIEVEEGAKSAKV